VAGGSREARAEKGLGVELEPRLAVAEPDGAGAVLAGRELASDQSVEDGENTLDRPEDVRLGAAERREPEGRELALEGAQVPAPQHEVVEEVASAVAGGRRDLRQLGVELPLDPVSALADRLEVRDQAFELGLMRIDGAVRFSPFPKRPSTSWEWRDGA
jgi:extradiol dioxygenase family protein